MKTFRFKHIDAFTTKPFTGNAAGVVLDAKGLSEQRMQAIAREMGLSETAFILPPTLASADVHIRWFSPEVEIPLCGHATIASFHALAEEGMAGMKKLSTYHFRLQTKRGVLPIAVEKRFSGTIVEMGLPVPDFRVRRRLHPSMLAALNLRASDIAPTLPTVSDSYLYLPIKRLSVLHKLSPDFHALRKECRAMKVLGVSVFSLKTVEESSAVHSRFFAPAAGIDEDAVTGSANGPLGVYLYRYVLGKGFNVPWLHLEDGRMEFIGEQGDAIGRRGRVKIRLSAAHRKVQRVSIAGEAVTIYNAELKC